MGLKRNKGGLGMMPFVPASADQTVAATLEKTKAILDTVHPEDRRGVIEEVAEGLGLENPFNKDPFTPKDFDDRFAYMREEHAKTLRVRDDLRKALDDLESKKKDHAKLYAELGSVLRADVAKVLEEIRSTPRWAALNGQNLLTPRADDDPAVAIVHALANDIREAFDRWVIARYFTESERTRITAQQYEDLSKEKELEILRAAFMQEMEKQIGEALQPSFKGELEDDEALIPVSDEKACAVGEIIEGLDRDLKEGRITQGQHVQLSKDVANSVVGFKAAFAGLCDDSSDHALMEFSLDAWTMARARFWKKHHEHPSVSEMQHGVSLGIDELYRFAEEQKRTTAKRVAVFAVTWAEHAFQRLMTSHTYASALMCSDASLEVLESIEVPWLAFQVVIPNDILTMTQDEKLVDFTRAMVVSAGETAGAFLLLHDPNTKKIMSTAGSSLAHLLFDDVTLITNDELDAPRASKILKLTKRLVAGLLLAMQHRDNFKTRDVKASWGVRKDRKDPAHRITMIGRPISVDCRKQVSAYLAGTHKKHAPPSVQVLVRGHYKRQVMGVARSGRKVIWVEPYWRGPEDAPILTKPKQVG